ncbi:MAG: diphosphate--fructose-6-phosphate 1-phosphotransferase [Candidatus Bipolaricaulota bacterium]|nr:diphosphate--fructose-6-phosphate 1-phosphotransferase [Candidatus Bipolaricaulota bacterium]MDW8127188.1 diphosphate--fructose-6-phosphate 1-phosphotransferase [Candidatus Bipolaricaulota bacterium]
MAPKNAVVVMGGGPTVVINNSLRAIVEASREYPQRFAKVYGAWHGVEGLLREELLDLSAQPQEEIALLRTTPAAGAIGTTRYRLQDEEDLQRIIAVLQAHGIGYFFGIGGNDTQEVCLRVAEVAKHVGYELCVVGIPKTIDNDLGDPELRQVDHTPGYGSVARYWTWTVQCLEEENRGSAPVDPVLVVQTMGRKIGFIPAAARLADPEREFPLLILFAEAPLSLEAVADAVADTVRRRGRAVVVVSEGFPVGEIGARTDAFGHVAFSASRLSVAQALVNFLNDVGLPAQGHARGQLPGTEQRDAVLYASTVDLEEAYAVGQVGVELAAQGVSDVMVTIRRAAGPVYRPEYGTIPLSEVAGKDRPFPKEWIHPSRVDVTDDFVRYARPLLGEDLVSVPIVEGRLRFARLRPIFAEKRLAAYVPAAHRERRQG